MKIFGWLLKSNNDSGDSTEGKITVDKALDLAKAYEELKPFFGLFLHFFKNVADSEANIQKKLEAVQAKTQQNLQEEQLMHDLWVLRYALSHLWLFDLKPPKNQTELSDELLVISSALKSILTEKNKLDYLPWLKQGFSEFTGIDQLDFKNLKKFQKEFSDKLQEKIPRIVFDRTGGRLGGELHDFVIELIMTTIQMDQKVFTVSDENTLTNEEADNIKNAISELGQDRREAAEDFIKSFK